MCRTAVCVLNYLNYKETENCVDSVLMQRDSNYQIIVVDNGSENESYSFLKKRYHGEQKVTVLRVHKNYGFAKGHNIGIHYARKYFAAEYVLLLNSDIILPEERYIKKMVDADEHGVGVLGSRIILRGGREYEFEKQYTKDYGQLMAASIIVSAPIVALFFTFQKLIVSGLTGGSVKE